MQQGAGEDPHYNTRSKWVACWPDRCAAHTMMAFKHKDKSMTNKRIMLRLTQTPTKIHYLMMEGADRLVYNIQMQGLFAYGGGQALK